MYEHTNSDSTKHLCVRKAFDKWFLFLADKILLASTQNKILHDQTLMLNINIIQNSMALQQCSAYNKIKKTMKNSTNGKEMLWLNSESLINQVTGGLCLPACSSLSGNSSALLL